MASERRGSPRRKDPCRGAIESKMAPSGRAARERRAEARRRLERARAREEMFGETFDFLRATDCLRALLCVGEMEVYVAAEAGWMLDPRPWCKPASALVFALCASVLALGQTGAVMSLWAVAKFLCCFRSKVLRPVYYPHERKRRERLAAERRRIRDRFTAGACPTAEELLARFARVRNSERDAIRFGSLMCDLEAHCDNSLVRNDFGEIVGRNPGVRGWLRTNCPELAAHYSKAMHYKALAEKFRQAVGAGDPVPAEWLAEEEGESLHGFFGGRGHFVKRVQVVKANGNRKGHRIARDFEVDAERLDAAWKRAQELLAEVSGTPHEAAGTKEKTDVGTRCVRVKEDEAEEARKSRKTREARKAREALKVEKAEKARKARKDSLKNARIQYGMVARLEAALDERLAPEYAPTGWRMADVSPPRSVLA